MADILPLVIFAKEENTQWAASKLTLLSVTYISALIAGEIPMLITVINERVEAG